MHSAASVQMWPQMVQMHSAFRVGVWPPGRPAAARQPSKNQPKMEPLRKQVQSTNNKIYNRSLQCSRRYGRRVHRRQQQSRPRNFSSWNEPKRPFWAKSWPGAFWNSNLSFWTARGRLLNVSSGNEPKRPFWAKSWPGTFWNTNLQFWTARGRLLNVSSRNEPKRHF